MSAGAGVLSRPDHAFGTSYFYFLKYNVFTIERNISRYLVEIHHVRDLLSQGEETTSELLHAVNENKGKNTYHPRTTKRILDLTRKNFADPRATETDQLLIALTYWQICKLQKVPSVLAFLMKGAKGGRSTDHQFLEDGGAYTCVDTTAVTAALCKALEIPGEIKNDGIGSVLGFHHFFETPDGRIVDVPFGLKEGGFFFDSADHPKTFVIVVRFLRKNGRRIARKLGLPTGPR